MDIKINDILLFSGGFGVCWLVNKLAKRSEHFGYSAPFSQGLSYVEGFARDEYDYSVPFAQATGDSCHDCGAKVGKFHDEGCDVAQCMNCGEQHLLHLDTPGWPKRGCDSPRIGVWTGEWHNDEDAEFDPIERFTGHDRGTILGRLEEIRDMADGAIYDIENEDYENVDWTFSDIFFAGQDLHMG